MQHQIVSLCVHQALNGDSRDAQLLREKEEADAVHKALAPPALPFTEPAKKLSLSWQPALSPVSSAELQGFIDILGMTPSFNA